MASNPKSSNGTEHDDWLGDLLVSVVQLAGIVMWRFALRWPDLATVIAVTMVTAVVADLRWACVIGVLTAVLVWGWRLGWPDSYQQYLGRPVADYRRAYLVYRRRWRTICEHHGLAISPRGDRDADPMLPTLREVRIGACVDTLVVRLLVGQSAKTWEGTADGLAAAFGAHNVVITAGTVEAGRGRDIVLRVRHHDALMAPIPLPRPRPDTRPTVARVAVGVTEDATAWTLPVTGRHILIGGATGAGKGSVMWSLVAGRGAGTGDPVRFRGGAVHRSQGRDGIWGGGTAVRTVRPRPGPHPVGPARHRHHDAGAGEPAARHHPPAPGPSSPPSPASPITDSPT